ncbi:MAG TPA: carboxypeptidase regulatory-like domain-containing protein [Gemmatimonadaceae bacterium]|nr:carboxypeptidase regulatory-like domain-containing protein [Gemmatimonadaceae bacterium]
MVRLVNTPVIVRRSGWLGIVVVFSLATPLAVGAQTIRGRVFLADSVTPVAGIVVTANGPGNVTAARALSTSRGDYLLQLRAPGRYEVRALRIGFRPAVVRDVVVKENATSVQNIVLSSLPVAIAGMDVRDDRDCSLSKRDGETFLQLWEQARGALAATQLSEQSGALDVRMVRADGHIDAPILFADSLYEIVDTLRARESIVDRVFAATPAETLTVRGFVRLTPDGRTVYDMPNAETLLSDAFVASHCFSVRSSDDHKDWIGLGFRPRRTTKGIIDIRGALWLDRATAELRRVDFDYTDLPAAEYEVCDSNPFVTVTPERLREVPRFEQPNPRCEGAKNDRSNRLGLGGYADFVRLPSGEWLVSKWMIRTPPDEGRIRPMPWRVRRVKQTTERCYSGPDCHTVLAMRPRLVTSMGAITAVMRDGMRVYQNEKGAALISAMSAKRAGGHPAAVQGIVTDLTGRPLINAVLQTEAPWRAAQTDSVGAFHFQMLPPDTINVVVRCRGYQPVRARLPLLGDSTRHLTLSLVPDSVSSSSTNCATVFGRRGQR